MGKQQNSGQGLSRSKSKKSIVRKEEKIKRLKKKQKRLLRKIKDLKIKIPTNVYGRGWKYPGKSQGKTSKTRHHIEDHMIPIPILRAQEL